MKGIENANPKKPSFVLLLVTLGAAAVVLSGAAAVPADTRARKASPSQAESLGTPVLRLAQNQGQKPSQEPKPPQATTLFERVIEQARKLAQQSYTPPASNIPQALKDLNYRAYRGIRFEKDRELWGDDRLFSVEFFHLGFLYEYPVVIHEVVDDRIRRIRYDPTAFDFGTNKKKPWVGELHPGLGFAGFRVHYPINTPNYRDEVIAFLGASYFRMVGRGQSYGLSARGLAINTALSSGEEFPRFSEFWLVRPAPNATTLTFYALLESASVTGAYRFVLDPNGDTTLGVEAHLFAREDIEKLGVAPLTSMFMWGENRVRAFDDYRPEVHDSDGLLVHTGRGEWIWRALVNPVDLQVSSLIDKNPRGFGLVQRDRRFARYQDLQANYRERPSLWVTPLGKGARGKGDRSDWGTGAVQLVEIPSRSATNDNIVAFWVPEKPFQAGETRSYRYRLQTFWTGKPPDDLALVSRTRIGRRQVASGEASPLIRQFIVDFAGGVLTRMADAQPVRAEFSISRGQIRDLAVKPLPRDGGWRVAFKLHPEDASQAVDMRLYLQLRGRRISETWNYVWDPQVPG